MIKKIVNFEIKKFNEPQFQSQRPFAEALLRKLRATHVGHNAHDFMWKRQFR